MTDDIPTFGGRLLDSGTRTTRIGDGSLGGKGHGLVRAQRVLDRSAGLQSPGFVVDVPPLTVLGTDLFAGFVEGSALAGIGGPDDRIAQAFLAAALPAELERDLRAIATEARFPLAVRSSSALEDQLGHPLAGVYLTKMIPGSQIAPEERFRALSDAIKLVYASTFFAGARSYRRVLGLGDGDERMGVVLQEVVGRTRGDRFYPEISGVARSLNAYPVGSAEPEQGIVSLALGLGKTIVDGGVCWSFSPSLPRVGPPFGSSRDRVRGTQTRFWAIDVGTSPRDPARETEYLVHLDLDAAETDGALAHTASSYDLANDRITPGIGRPGTRVIDFAPLLELEQLPLAAQLRTLLDACETEMAGPVEIEFAVALPRRPSAPAHLGLLQVRPLGGFGDELALDEDDLAGDDVLVSSFHAAGSGVRSGLHDLVFVDPERFDPLVTRVIARELGELNAQLLAEGRRYVLIGFGRWGTADPSLGIPVTWPQVCAASALVESALPSFRVEPSQGSHFFHNLVNLHVLYLSTGAPGEQPVDWDWLRQLEVVRRTPHVLHVRTDAPLSVRVDGRRRRGAVVRSRG